VQKNINICFIFFLDKLALAINLGIHELLVVVDLGIQDLLMGSQLFQLSLNIGTMKAILASCHWSRRRL